MLSDWQTIAKSVYYSGNKDLFAALLSTQVHSTTFYCVTMNERVAHIQLFIVGLFSLDPQPGAVVDCFGVADCF